MYRVPFNRPTLLDRHFDALRDAISGGSIAGNGGFSRQCEREITTLTGVPARLVTSATHALELSALLLKIAPGDEVIVPSFTFVSTANAFALRGAALRFADNDEYGNIRPTEVERLLSPRTRAIVVVHYAGASCDMDQIIALAARAGVPVIEDAAQAIGATYRGRPLGSIGDLGCLSFHETKNVTAGEGGALLFGREAYLERAQVLIEKGTDRARFHLGLVDKYTWVDVGSSYVLSDLNAAYLFPQLVAFQRIQDRRREICDRYRRELTGPLLAHGVRMLDTPPYNTPNYHLLALLMPSREQRDAFIAFMRQREVCCPFHYVPLHSSPFGSQFVARGDALPGAEQLSDALVRLPLYFNMTDEEQGIVIDAVQAWTSR